MATRHSDPLRSRFHTGAFNDDAAQSATSDSRIFGAIGLIFLGVAGFAIVHSLWS